MMISPEKTINQGDMIQSEWGESILERVVKESLFEKVTF